MDVNATLNKEKEVNDISDVEPLEVLSSVSNNGKSQFF